jgi:hypothetical protein
MAVPSREHLAAREAEIKTLIEQDKREEAGNILFELVTSSAQGGDLATANRLRDWLYDVNPMALNQIIKANEIIEEAMSASIDESFLRAWANLKQVLGEEEFSLFYHCLEKHEVGEGKQIVKAGSKLDALFLVTRGNVKVYCRCGEKMVQVKDLEPGAMIGANIFEPSVWAVTLATASPVSLAVLRYPGLMELYDRFPGFEARLTGYYQRFDDIGKLLGEQKLDRRSFKRKKADARITFRVVDKEGRAGDRGFRGELDNICRGGLAFFLRIAKRENRRQLFGRRLVIETETPEGAQQFTGSVTAVTMQDFQEHDYAVHVAFDSPVAEETIKPLIVPVAEEEELIPEEVPEAGEGETAGEG